MGCATAAPPVISWVEVTQIEYVDGGYTVVTRPILDGQMTTNESDAVIGLGVHVDGCAYDGTFDSPSNDVPCFTEEAFGDPDSGQIDYYWLFCECMDVGAHSAAFHAKDAGGLSLSSPLDIVVEDSAPPSPVARIPPILRVGDVTTVDVTAGAPSCDSLSLIVEDAPAGMDVTLGSAAPLFWRLTYVPSVDDVGDWDVRLKVEDNEGNETSASSQFTVVRRGEGSCSCASATTGGPTAATSLLMLFVGLALRFRRSNL